ncbi:MAG TPA: proton-conducting transporter membrane subunit, partial [Hyphomicrobiaceae bacterium]|nr:proton-conducting transporter membrane subunit [Hyphomicrobiaceae bacterium]
AALRYLMFALLGSVLYLAGTALLYGSYGTLDIILLSHRVQAEPAILVAAALMTVGLLAKTALVPLHLWLPPAHAGAPAAARAVLSALVVKGSFFIVVRLWFDVFVQLPSFALAQLLAMLGAAAIVFGSVVALRQERLKLLIAYSTLAQIGYLFLMFPLAFATGSARLESGGALASGILQAMSHATAKAAMFMTAGLFYAALGHDRIAGLGGVGRARPISVLAFALAGVALIGVPPSGASLAKDLLLQAAAETAQWWWTVVVHAGGILTSSYVQLVLAHALAPADAPITLHVPAARVREGSALVLALCSLLLGLFPWQGYLPVAQGAAPAPPALKAFSSSLWPVLGGVALAVLPLGRALRSPSRGQSRRRNSRPRAARGASRGRRCRTNGRHAPAMAGGGPCPFGDDAPLRRRPLAGGTVKGELRPARRALPGPRGRRAAEQRDELAPLHRCNHSITSSASNCSAFGHFEAERSGRLQVDDELEFGRLQDRQVGGIGTLEDLTGVDSDLTKHIEIISPIAHQPTGFDILAKGIGHGNPVARRERRKLDPPAAEERVASNEQGIGPVARERGEGRLDFPAGARFEDLNLQSEGAGSFRYVS